MFQIRRLRASLLRQDSMDIPSNRNNEETIGASLLKGLNRLRQVGTFCDITFRVGEKVIRAHKNVICACSPYFDALLVREANDQEVVINNIDPDYLELVIEYMYTGTLNFDSSNVKGVLLTASFLLMPSAEELCCKFMENNLVLDNCIEYILFSGKNSIKLLRESSLDMAVLNFHHIFSKNDYLEIEFEEFKQMTQMIKDNGNPEDLIYAFVMRWINYSVETRGGHMPELLHLLEFSLISPEVKNSPEVGLNSNPLLPAWAAAHNVHPFRNDSAQHILVSRRLGRFRPQRVQLFSNLKPYQIDLIPNNITDGSYVCNGYYIYHQGGWMNHRELLTDSYAYHQTKRVWVPFVPLQQARAYHHSCVLNGKIFSVGGSDGVRALPSVEFTDIHTGQRGFIDPLPLAKERAGLGLHDNSIYVVGGNDRGKSYKCIHRFDAREGVWQELTPSPYRAGATSCAVLGDNIYTTHPDALQRYDIRANDWALIFGQYKRYPQEVFSLDDTLFGIFNGHIAKFLPDRGKWENLRSLKFYLPHLQVSTNLRFPIAEVENRDNIPLLFLFDRLVNGIADEEDEIEMIL